MRPFGGPDFRAEIALLDIESGRLDPIASGYRASMDLGLPRFNDGEVKLVDTESIQPGESGIAEINLFAPNLQLHRLFEGMRFSMHEGWRKVGFGTILEIHNQELVKKTHA